jgi:hypothetical protein
MLTTIVFIHGVISLAALRSIIPNVGEATARLALRYAWQCGCALYACFGTETGGEETPSCAEDAVRLIDRALANGDEHVIKFTEACLRRHSLAPPRPIAPLSTTSSGPYPRADRSPESAVNAPK